MDTVYENMKIAIRDKDLSEIAQASLELSPEPHQWSGSLSTLELDFYLNSNDLASPPK